MTSSVGVYFDTEARIVFVAVFNHNENGETTMLSEDGYQKSEWIDMDDDAWLREIPAINAEVQTNAFIAKLQVESL